MKYIGISSQILDKTQKLSVAQQQKIEKALVAAAYTMRDKSLFGGQTGDCIFTKKPIKSTKKHFFRFFIIFVFRCMVEQP